MGGLFVSLFFFFVGWLVGVFVSCVGFCCFVVAFFFLLFLFIFLCFFCVSDRCTWFSCWPMCTSIVGAVPFIYVCSTAVIFFLQSAFVQGELQHYGSSVSRVRLRILPAFRDRYGKCVIPMR